jgi:hypothetical protein
MLRCKAIDPARCKRGRSEVPSGAPVLRRTFYREQCEVVVDDAALGFCTRVLKRPRRRASSDAIRALAYIERGAPAAP